MACAPSPCAAVELFGVPVDDVIEFEVVVGGGWRTRSAVGVVVDKVTS